MAQTAALPFFWGSNGERLSASQVRSRRQVVDAMLAGRGTPRDVGEGLNYLGQTIYGMAERGRLEQAESEGQALVAQAMADAQAGGGADGYMSVLGNEWASPQQSAVAQAMLNRIWGREDRDEQRAYDQPMRDAQLQGANLSNERAAFELDQLRSPPVDPWAGIKVINDQAVSMGEGGPEVLGDFRNAPEGELTDTMRNLLWRAQQAGLEPGTPEWNQFMVAGGQGGTALTVGPDGTVSFSTGAAKPLTEGQSKDTVYATRAAGSLPLIDQFGDALTNPVQHAMGIDPTGVLRGNQTPEFQQGQQAALEFLQAILRKDTGAAITPAETAEYSKVYIPQPGDTPEVLEQKRVSRARALAAIEAGLPPQAILQQEEALLRSGSGSTPAPTSGGQSQANPIIFGDNPADPLGLR